MDTGDACSLCGAPAISCYLCFKNWGEDGSCTHRFCLEHATRILEQMSQQQSGEDEDGMTRTRGNKGSVCHCPVCSIEELVKSVKKQSAEEDEQIQQVLIKAIDSEELSLNTHIKQLEERVIYLKGALDEANGKLKLCERQKSIIELKRLCLAAAIEHPPQQVESSMDSDLRLIDIAHNVFDGNKITSSEIKRLCDMAKQELDKVSSVNCVVPSEYDGNNENQADDSSDGSEHQTSSDNQEGMEDLAIRKTDGRNSLEEGQMEGLYYIVEQYPKLNGDVPHTSRTMILEVISRILLALPGTKLLEMGKHLLPSLLETVEDERDGVKQGALTCIKVLCDEGAPAELKDVFVLNDGVATITALLGEAQPGTAVELILNILLSITQHGDAKVLIDNGESVRAVAQAIHQCCAQIGKDNTYGDGLIGRVMLISLRILSLVTQDSSSPQVLQDLEILPPLLKIVQSEDKAAYSLAVGVLWNMVVANPEWVGDVLKEVGGVSALLATLNDRGKVVYARECVAAILWSMAVEPIAKQQLIESGAVNVIVPILAAGPGAEEGSDILMNNVAGILWNISTTDIARQQLIAQGAVEMLVEYIALDSATCPTVQSETMSSVAGILRNIMMNKEARALLIPCGGVSSLLKSLADVAVEYSVKEKIVSALWLASKEVDVAVEIDKVTGAVETITSFCGQCKHDSHKDRSLRLIKNIYKKVKGNQSDVKTDLKTLKFIVSVITEAVNNASTVPSSTLISIVELIYFIGSKEEQRENVIANPILGKLLPLINNVKVSGSLLRYVCRLYSQALEMASNIGVFYDNNILTYFSDGLQLVDDQQTVVACVNGLYITYKYMAEATVTNIPVVVSTLTRLLETRQPDVLISCFNLIKLIGNKDYVRTEMVPLVYPLLDIIKTMKDMQKPAAFVLQRLAKDRKIHKIISDYSTKM